MRTRRIVVIAALILIGAAVFFAVRPVVRARTLTKDIEALQEQHITRDLLRTWAKQNGGTVTESGDRFEAEVVSRNVLLHSMRLSPPVEFAASVLMRGETPIRAGVSLGNEAAGGPTSEVVYVYSPDAVFDSGFGKYRLVASPVGKPPARTLFVNTRNAEPGSQALGERLNVWCLARIGGCTLEQQGQIAP